METELCDLRKPRLVRRRLSNDGLKHAHTSGANLLLLQKALLRLGLRRLFTAPNDSSRLSMWVVASVLLVQVWKIQMTGSQKWRRETKYQAFQRVETSGVSRMRGRPSFSHAGDPWHACQLQSPPLEIKNRESIPCEARACA